jgi:hypothetical protein
MEPNSKAIHAFKVFHRGSVGFKGALTISALISKCRRYFSGVARIISALPNRSYDSAAEFM